jgi:hypothetical protein
VTEVLVIDLVANGDGVRTEFQGQLLAPSSPWPFICQPANCRRLATFPAMQKSSSFEMGDASAITNLRASCACRRLRSPIAECPSADHRKPSGVIMSAVSIPRKRLTEKEAILRGVMSSPNINPRWRSAMIAECQRPGRYSAVRVAEAVRAQIDHERMVASAIEFSAAVKRGPRGRRPLSAE